MPHATPLLSTIAAGLVLAFLFGALANRLKLSPIVGYLVAGIVVGPFTPGYVADAPLAAELAEIGVILLMFGVGLHFSLKDLLAVRTIAVPGAAVQIGVATVLGVALAWGFGWSLGAGLVFGLALSVASTVVLLKALEERRLLDTRSGHIAVGWLIVEDLAMVLTLVLLPAVAGLLGGVEAAGVDTSAGAIAWRIGVTLAQVALFVALMLIVGTRVVPFVMARIVRTGSRELFTLAVLATAFGIALGAAYLFGVSFALGAFFAGMVLGESELSQQAAEDSLPFRDAFAVLFFVSIGMLFDPGVLLRAPLAVLATCAIIVVGKSIAAYLIVRAFGLSHRTGLLIAASLAQIGEFSFILMNLGTELRLLPDAGRDYILAGAMLSIVANPFVFSLAGRWTNREPDVDPPAPLTLTDHILVIGYGRVGRRAAAGLTRAGARFAVIDLDADRVAALTVAQTPAVPGNAADPRILRSANVEAARTVLVAVPDELQAGEIVAAVKRAAPHVRVLARTHLEAGIEHLTAKGADRVIFGEREIARLMVEDAAGPAT